MTLLWGLREDGTMNSVYEHLQQMDCDVVFLNHAEIDTTEIVFESEPLPSYKIKYQSKNYDLGDFTSAYLRPYNFRDYAQFSGEGNSSRLIKSADIFHHIIHSWAEHSPARIINRPSAEATNHSKMFQAMQIASAGFLTPESLISNDPNEILEFHKLHGSTIYKSMSSVRSIVKEFIPENLNNKANLGLVFFQRKIAGTNIRVHIVGEKVFACRIESSGVDYRYAQSQLTPCTIADEIAGKCITLSKNLGLLLTGIDFIVTDEGDWYCLEANPSPGFSYFDIVENKPIAFAVAEALNI